MILDIIVPHYNEPWEECSKLFEMLALQRFVNFKDFLVLLVNDGESNIIQNVYARHYPYEVVGLTIPHKGVSAARNKGLEYSKAEWVMFCDCDDTFTDIYSLQCILNVLGDKKNDLLWCPFYIEQSGFGSVTTSDTFNCTFIHGKVFRRSFLIEHNLRFNEELTYSEDTAFCSVVNMELSYKRVGKINCSLVPYVWAFRKGSATTDINRVGQNAVGLFRRQKYVAEQYKLRGLIEEANQTAYRGMCDAYMTILRTDIDHDESFIKEAKQFCDQWSDCEKWVTKEVAEKAIDGAFIEATVYDNSEALPSKAGFKEWYEKFKKGVW